MLAGENQLAVVSVAWACSLLKMEMIASLVWNSAKQGWMQIPLPIASLCPLIISRPVGMSFLRREQGKTVSRAYPGRDNWEGAGGSVRQDLRFSHGWRETQREEGDCTRLRLAGVEKCQTLLRNNNVLDAHISYSLPGGGPCLVKEWIEMSVKGLNACKKLEQQRWDVRSVCGARRLEGKC